MDIRKQLSILLGCLALGLFTINSLGAQEPVQQTLCCEGDCSCGCKEGVICCCEQRPVETYPSQYGDSDCRHAFDCGLCGVWFPEDPPLFRPFVADPREIDYSVGWRFDDQALEKNVIDVSYGDIIGVYEWCCVLPWKGRMRIDLEGALWAVFSPCQESSPLINADYFIGLAATYAINRWQFRWRTFHISSHIGDEFLINHWHKGGFKRYNPSAEFTDIFVSHDLTDDLRVYGGAGVVLHQDETFRCGRIYAAAGCEYRWRELGFVNCCHQIYGTPYYGMYFRFQKDFKHHVDSTYVLGYEWGKLSGLQRRLRAFLEYHDGYSAEGQFLRFATNYLSIRLSYGY